MTALYYEVRVAGVVPPEALLDFEDLVAVEPVETILHGLLPDQAALHGLLARLETFGMQVLEVRRLRETGPIISRLPASPGASSLAAACPGSADVFGRAVAEFASGYADQNEHDHRRLAEAAAAGRITAARDV